MATVLEVVLVADRYDAGAGQDPTRPEWPPHPARVFSALRAVADDVADLALLRTVEGWQPPVVHAARDASPARSRAYVVTNAISSGGGNLNHPGRTSGQRTRRSVFPDSPFVQLEWEHELDDEALAALDRLARRVPYLGRSTSVVMMGVRRTAADHRPPGGTIAHRPCGPDEPLASVLRVPYPGLLDELDSLFAAGLSAWQASDGGPATQAYLADGIGGSPRAGVDDAVRAAASPYRDLVVLRIEDAKPDGRLAATFTAALKSMVMSRTDEPLPPALHGHGLPGTPHVAYLSLPTVGHRHADGHLVALAVAVPGMDEQERRRILRGVLGSSEDDVVQLAVPGLKSPVRLRYAPQERRPVAATARRWTTPSRSWVTVTPVVLDRFPKDGDLAGEVRASVERAGLPSPALVQVSLQPMTPGAVRMLPRDLPTRARGKLFRHVRLQFDEPVSGPVLVGAGRYLGVGLFCPEPDETPEDSELDGGAR